MAGDDAHRDLLRFFPNAIKAECEGDGVWASVTHSDGYEAAVKCPVCANKKFVRAVAAFPPPRFRKPVALPDAVAEWAEKGFAAQGLYLAGPVGTGKTHTAWTAVTAWCVAAEIMPYDEPEDNWTGIRRGPTVIFTRLTDLLDDLRPGDAARMRVRDCQKCSLLIIDDIGAEKASEWTQERLYSIIDHRYANCLPLIVTSNLPPAKLEDQAGKRTASRLAEMCLVVPMTGTDRRKPAA